MSVLVVRISSHMSHLKKIATLSHYNPANYSYLVQFVKYKYYVTGRERPRRRNSGYLFVESSRLESFSGKPSFNFSRYKTDTRIATHVLLRLPLLFQKLLAHAVDDSAKVKIVRRLIEFLYELIVLLAVEVLHLVGE